jgi:hypothetical protein
LPVTLGTDTITITGNVNVSTVVQVNSSPSNPVHNHITEVGTGGILTVPYLPVHDVLTANVRVINLAPSLNVFVRNTANVRVSNLPSSLNVYTRNTGNVRVLNLPSSLNVYTRNTGNVRIVNLPASLNVYTRNTGNVRITNLPASLNVYSRNTGNVRVINLPASQNTNIRHSNGTAITATHQLPVISTPATNTFTYVKYVDETNTQLDAVGRLRVSPPVQSYWYTPAVDKDGDLRYQEKFAQTANSYFVQNMAAIRMTSGSVANGSAIRVSRRRHKMRPGVSLEWVGVHNFLGAQTNVTKRRGFYTQYNGLFYEVTDDLYIVVRKRLEEGTLVETRIARSNFNKDKLDGTGSANNPTGFNLNPATSSKTYNINSFTSKTGPTSPQNSTETFYKVTFAVTGEVADNIVSWELGDYLQIENLAPSGYNQMVQLVAKSAGSITVAYTSDPGTISDQVGTVRSNGLYKKYSWFIDFEGTRTTRIRFGVLTKEGPYIVHLLDYAGTSGVSWSNAPAMPDRMEIFNTGAVTYQPNMLVGSSTINVEAELELNPGFGSAYNNAGIAAAVNVEKVLLGVGLRAGEPYQRADLQIQQIQVADKANVPGKNQDNSLLFWRLVLNPTVAGFVPAPTNVGKATRQWAYTANTTISGGTTLLTGYGDSGALVDARTALNFLNMGSNVDNTDADKLVLVATVITAGSTATSSLVASINLIESL